MLILEFEHKRSKNKNLKQPSNAYATNKQTLKIKSNNHRTKETRTFASKRNNNDNTKISIEIVLKITTRLCYGCKPDDEVVAKTKVVSLVSFLEYVSDA